jgi:LPXTG-site transpeptidase (sortase) family protein
MFECDLVLDGEPGAASPGILVAGHEPAPQGMVAHAVSMTTAMTGTLLKLSGITRMPRFGTALLIYLIAFNLINGCGNARPAPPRVAQQPALPPSVIAPALPSAQPLPTPPTTASIPPRPTSTLTSPTATINAFKVLTALALTPTRTPVATSPPQRLLIPKIGLDEPVQPVDQDQNGTAVVLKHEIAWYRRSGTPGERTSIILWAHVLRWKDTPRIPAPFERVDELAVGDRLFVTTTAGNQFEYVVTYHIRVRPNQVEYLDPAPLERVVLISCIGDNVIVNGEVTKEERLITIAEPVG